MEKILKPQGALDHLDVGVLIQSRSLIGLLNLSIGNGRDSTDIKLRFVG